LRLSRIIDDEKGTKLRFGGLVSTNIVDPADLDDEGPYMGLVSSIYW